MFTICLFAGAHTLRHTLGFAPGLWGRRPPRVLSPSVISCNFKPCRRLIPSRVHLFNKHCQVPTVNDTYGGTKASTSQVLFTILRSSEKPSPLDVRGRGRLIYRSQMVEHQCVRDAASLPACDWPSQHVGTVAVASHPSVTCKHICGPFYYNDSCVTPRKPLAGGE